jgi:hypothetical protein
MSLQCKTGQWKIRTYMNKRIDLISNRIMCYCDYENLVKVCLYE